MIYWRDDEPVDGAGLPLREHSERFARDVPPDVAEALVHELRNALGPLKSPNEARRGKAIELLHALADALAKRARERPASA